MFSINGGLKISDAATEAVDRDAVRLAAMVVRERVPSLLCGLNVAQYRALRSTYAVDVITGRIPAINVVSFANGVGKTHMMVLDMIGWTMGPQFLDWQKFPAEAIEFYHSLASIRDKGQLSLRLVCASDDMKGDGSVLMLLRELFPLARLAAKDQLGCYRQIDVPHPSVKGVVNSIAVKTFDQDKLKHSGSTCSRVWINEPLPDGLAGETVGRIRSKKGGDIWVDIYDGYAA